MQVAPEVETMEKTMAVVAIRTIFSMERKIPNQRRNEAKELEVETQHPVPRVAHAVGKLRRKQAVPKEVKVAARTVFVRKKMPRRRNEPDELEADPKVN